jgi:hypothetical protein
MGIGAGVGWGEVEWWGGICSLYVAVGSCQHVVFVVGGLQARYAIGQSFGAVRWLCSIRGAFPLVPVRDGGGMHFLRSCCCCWVLVCAGLCATCSVQGGIGWGRCGVVLGGSVRDSGQGGVRICSMVARRCRPCRTHCSWVVWVPFLASAILFRLDGRVILSLTVDGLIPP